MQKHANKAPRYDTHELICFVQFHDDFNQQWAWQQKEPQFFCHWFISPTNVCTQMVPFSVQCNWLCTWWQMNERRTWKEIKLLWLKFRTGGYLPTIAFTAHFYVARTCRTRLRKCAMISRWHRRVYDLLIIYAVMHNNDTSREYFLNLVLDLSLVSNNTIAT